MNDWLDNLSDEERQQWNDFVDHSRRESIEKMAGSAAVVSLVPADDMLDPKFCLELGAAIIMGKPIVFVVAPGASLPMKMRAVADAVIDIDIDLEEGQAALAAALKKVGLDPNAAHE